MAKMLDLEELTTQTKAAIEKVIGDMTMVRDKKPDIGVVTVLMSDILVMQVAQASLTLAFLERWADVEEGS